MLENMMKIIDSHNGVVNALSNSDLPVSSNHALRAMTIWHTLACEGADIVHMAREMGIDAKVDMQTGFITVYGQGE